MVINLATTWQLNGTATCALRDWEERDSLQVPGRDVILHILGSLFELVGRKSEGQIHSQWLHQHCRFLAEVQMPEKLLMASLPPLFVCSSPNLKKKIKNNKVWKHKQPESLCLTQSRDQWGFPLFCSMCFWKSGEENSEGREGVIPGSRPFYQRLKWEKANSCEMMRLGAIMWAG